MPFVRIDTYQSTPAAGRKTIADAVYEAMRATIGIPEGDRFIVVTAHEKDEFFVDPAFQGMQRTERFILVEIRLNKGRTAEIKQALYKSVAEKLHEAVGVSTDDVMTLVTECTPADWSFGKGEAQFILHPPAWVKQPGEGK
jgi:phenylpyruvate tautomerase PptA (4-oxalocrotonate tautomerase family)